MRLHIMEPIISNKPHQSFLFRSFDAGLVGQVGDTQNRIRGRSSAPDLPMVWSTDTSGNKILRYGTQMQDGNLDDINGHLKKGGHGRLSDTRWSRDFHSFKHQHGYSFRDIVTPDRATEPFMRGLPKYTYKSQVSRVFNARLQGEQFLPLPGPYEPPAGQIPRGGSYPRITDQFINGESSLYSNGLFNATQSKNISGVGFPPPPPKVVGRR